MEEDYLSVLAHALWGAAGAFVYAGPRLVACIKTCRSKGTPITECVGDFVVAILTGAIAGAACGLFVAAHLNQTQDHQVRAVVALTGFFANPVAPGLAKALSAKEILKDVLQAVLKALGGKA